MPPEELYDLKADHTRSTILLPPPNTPRRSPRLRHVLEKWSPTPNDQGRTLEPEELVKNPRRHQQSA